jgi:hypothetical protein
MVFVRTKLIPTEGLLALAPKSSALTFGPDATVSQDEFSSDDDDDTSGRGGGGGGGELSPPSSNAMLSATQEVLPVGCVGGLLFAITVLGVKFCFVSVRLSHGKSAEETRKSEVREREGGGGHLLVLCLLIFSSYISSQVC